MYVMMRFLYWKRASLVSAWKFVTASVQCCGFPRVKFGEKQHGCGGTGCQEWVRGGLGMSPYHRALNARYTRCPVFLVKFSNKVLSCWRPPFIADCLIIILLMPTLCSLLLWLFASARPRLSQRATTTSKPIKQPAAQKLGPRPRLQPPRRRISSGMNGIYLLLWHAHVLRHATTFSYYGAASTHTSCD